MSEFNGGIPSAHHFVVPLSLLGFLVQQSRHTLTVNLG